MTTIQIEVKDYTNELKHIAELNRLSDTVIEEAQKYISIRKGDVLEEICQYIHAVVKPFLESGQYINEYSYTNFRFSRWHSSEPCFVFEFTYMSSKFLVEFYSDRYVICKVNDKAMKWLVEHWAKYKIGLNNMISDMVSQMEANAKTKSNADVEYSRLLENFEL